MSVWLSSRGAGVINASEGHFTITAKKAKSLITPSDANKLEGSVIFPLYGLPQNASRIDTVDVDFTTHTAVVDQVAVMSGSHVLFKEEELGKTGQFKINLSNINIGSDKHKKGLALWIELHFENVIGKLEFRWVGIEVAVASLAPVQSVKLDTGTWNTTNVRPWNHPRDKTEGRIRFKTPFKSVPKVMVSLTGADVDGETNFRAKVYATDINAHGFIVHADTWGGTELYSAEVSWMAIAL